MKYTKTTIRELSARYRSVLKKCFLLNALAVGLIVATGAKAADEAYDPTASVATNLTNFHTAITTGTDTYTTNLGGTDYTIDADFAAAHPKYTRDALAQLLAGSSDAGDYAVVNTAVGDFVELTGGVISQKTLGVDLSTGTTGVTNAYTGTNYLTGATTMAGADKLLDTQVKANADAIATLNGTGDGSVSKTVGDAIDALDLANTYQAKLGTEQLAAVNSGITSTLVGKITTNESAIATLNGTGDGSVSKTVGDAIDALNATETQAAAAGNGQLALSITQENGVITGISGSIAANTYDAYGAAATAKSEAITAAATDATTKANTAEANAKTYAKNYTDTALGTLWDNAEAIFNEKQTWVDNTLGITSANANAVNDEYTGTNYLTAATTLTGADTALDTALKTLSDKVSSISANAPGDAPDAADYGFTDPEGNPTDLVAGASYTSADYTATSAAATVDGISAVADLSYDSGTLTADDYTYVTYDKDGNSTSVAGSTAVAELTDTVQTSDLGGKLDITASSAGTGSVDIANYELTNTAGDHYTIEASEDGYVLKKNGTAVSADDATTAGIKADLVNAYESDVTALANRQSELKGYYDDSVANKDKIATTMATDQATVTNLNNWEGSLQTANTNFTTDTATHEASVAAYDDSLGKVVDGKINTAVTTAVAGVRSEAEAIFAQKQQWVDDTLGITSANANAVNNEYADTNYLTDATTLTGADIVLDAQIKGTNDTIGDVNYADEEAVDGSVLKQGEGSTTTVRGALDALDANKANLADVYTRTEAEAIFNEKQQWVDNTLGITSANSNAVNNEYADTNYLTAATTLTGADIVLDGQIKGLDSRVGNLDTMRTALEVSTEQVGSLAEAVTYVNTQAKGYANTAETNAKNYADGKVNALDANVSQAAGADGLSLSITQTDGKITAISGAIAANTYDAYGAAANALADAKTYADGKVNALDANVSQAAGADGLSLNIVETDGKITSISGAIAANTYDAYGAADTAEANANTYTDNQIALLESATESAFEAVDETVGDLSSLENLKFFKGKEQANGGAVGAQAVGDPSSISDLLTNLNDNLGAEFARVDRRINKLETKMEKGLAANNALAGLVPLDHVHKTQVSAALGGYKNNQALAVGAFHYLNDRTLLNAGAAYGGNDSVSYKVGVTFGF